MKDSEEIRKVLNYPPSEMVEKMIKFKEFHKHKCLEDYGRYVKLFEEAFEILVEAVEALNYELKAQWAQHRGVQYVFFPGTLETLFRGFDDWSEGFYEEATILNRSVFESIFKIIFISLYPSDYEAIFAKKRLSGGRQFNLTDIIKKDLDIDWESFWHLSSTIAHGKTHRVLFFLCVLSRGDKRPVSLGLRYDKIRLTMPMNETVVLTWCLIRLLLFLFPEVLTSPKITDEGKSRLNNIEKSLRESLQNMPNKFKNVVADFGKVERKIKAAEQGLEWKKVV